MIISIPDPAKKVRNQPDPQHLYQRITDMKNFFYFASVFPLPSPDLRLPISTTWLQSLNFCLPTSVSPVSPLLSYISCLTSCRPSPVSPLVSPLTSYLSCLTSPVSPLQSHLSCLTSLVSPLQSSLSCLTFHISSLTSPVSVSHLSSLVFCLLSLICRLPFPPHLSLITPPKSSLTPN